MILLASLSILLLAVLPVWALTGIRRWKRPEAGGVARVTLLVPFRNEAERILPLLHSLENIRYDRLEIIFINDHSTDSGPQLVRDWIAAQSGARLLHNSPAQQGKKHALENGVKEANGSIILTTDADCHMDPDWVSVMAAGFRDPRAHMIAGLIAPDEESGIFHQFATLEMAALTGISAGSLGHNVPTMCNGANLAFRRTSFLAVGGHNDSLSVPSGDDEFLMLKMAQHFPGGVRYCVHPRALVYTRAVSDPGEWVRQRIRWSSKWKVRKSGQWHAPALAICYLFMMAGWASAMVTGYGFVALCILTSLKFLADYMLLHRIMQVWQKRPNLLFFLGSELFYPIYVMIFAILSFTRQYEWKGRRYKEALT